MDEAEGPPWARKYQGMAVPWDHSLGEVDLTMSKVGIIIGECRKVSSYFAARRGSLARALAEIRDDAAGPQHQEQLRLHHR